jgi:hypothetical protein
MANGGVQIVRQQLYTTAMWTNNVMLQRRTLHNISARVAHHIDIENAPPLEIQTTLDQYHKISFPTWMYQDPHNILGLEIPSIGEIAPMAVINKGWRIFNKRFHPDRWSRNGFVDESTAELAYDVGRRAHEALLEFYVNPYCEDNIQPFLEFDAAHAAADLPHFALNCTCSATHVARRTLHGLIAVVTQTAPRAMQNITSLADYCPCDSTRIESFLKTSSGVLAGSAPPLMRIYSRTPWDVFAPSAFFWKLRTSIMYVKADDTWQTSVNRPRWEADGWVSDEDWKWHLKRQCSSRRIISDL